MSAPRFYLGAISPYSWFAAERIGALIAHAQWRPVFAGGLFRAAGRESWGISDRRDAGIVDCETRAAAHGLGPMRWPEGWPASDVLPARAMVVADARGHLEPFALAIMRACFREGRDITRAEVLAELAPAAGLDGEALLAAVQEEATKRALRAATDEALAAGVFGVPSVVVGDEVFWGDDRLIEAADAAARSQRRA